MAGGRNEPMLFHVSCDDPSVHPVCGNLHEITLRELLRSEICRGAKTFHSDPSIVPPVRCQGPCGSCNSFAVCDVCAAAYLLYLKKKRDTEGKPEASTPVLLAPQGLIDFGSQNRSSKKRKRGTPDEYGVIASDLWQVFGIAKNLGLYLDRDLPFRARRVRKLNKDTLHVPSNSEENKIIELIRKQLCVALIQVSPEFNKHKGTSIFMGGASDFDDNEHSDKAHHVVVVLGYGVDPVDSTV